jgi:hypothetical protein
MRFSFVTLGEPPQENVAMWLDPLGMLVREFLKQVERAHRYKPVGIIGKRGELGDLCRILVNDPRGLF